MRAFWRGFRSTAPAKPIPGFHALNGVHRRIGDEDYICVPAGVCGNVIFGPYCELGPGRYEVEYQVAGPFPRDGVGCWVDVYRQDIASVEEKKDVTVAELRASAGVIKVPFEAKTRGRYEFRLYSTGRIPLNVRYDRSLRLIGALPADAALLLGADDKQAPEFYRAHYAAFAELARIGFVFRVAEGRVIATANATEAPVSFSIENDQDLFVVREIFSCNQYATLTSGMELDVVDIGMNVGLASLYFAAQPCVRRVLAFEPFAAPFRRAQRNFELNPVLRDKIEAAPIGLSDRNSTEIVRASSVDTIGVSIRGLDHGDEQKIEIEDASERIGPFVREAVAAGRKVVLKIDCEGSEFAIFQSLDRSNLLDDVTVILCEWHKWWSASLTQRDLIEPLTRRGYVVFDRTHASDDQIAGTFCAVRAAR